MITDIYEVLCPRGHGYQVIAYHDVLIEFLRQGGDYHFLVRDHDHTLFESTTGGNVIDWSASGDIVTLSSSLLRFEPCEIKKKVLIQAIQGLYGARKH